MKILYLEHYEQDFLSYFIFDGLCKILGDENVVVYPFKKSFFGQVDNDYILDHSGGKGLTGPGAYMIARESNSWSLQNILDRWSEFFLVVLASPRTYAIKALREIKSKLGSNFKKALALNDGEDSIVLRKDLIEEFKPDFVFKRELNENIIGINPLPFASVALDFVKDQDEKPLDVFCSFGNTWPIRKRIRDLLHADERLAKYNTIIRCDSDDNLIGYEQYLKFMAISKINIVARGHGMITVRQFESSSYSGLVLSDKIPVVIPNNWIDKEEIVYYKDDLSDLVEKIIYFLNHDDERRTMGRKGAEKTKRFHTARARASYFLRKCGFRL